MKIIEKIIKISILIFFLFIMTGCTKGEYENLLQENNPVIITLWHYHTDSVKALFEQQIADFNETIGREKGIIIDAYNCGNSNDFSESIYRSATKQIGTEPLPNIFMAYAEDIYRMKDIVEVVDLEEYFTKEELETYEPKFLENSKIDGSLKLLPVAKSTEAIYLNHTIWEPFSRDTNCSKDSLCTWEGLLDTAKQYYKWSNGKAFWGMDSIYHFVLMSAYQTGEPLFTEEKGNMVFNPSKKLAKQIWNMYFVPGLKGYYKKTGLYSYTDIQVGDTVSLTATTAGSSYLPVEYVDQNGRLSSIEWDVLPYPYYKNGKKVAPLRGADMCIVKSSKKEEYASAVFLKWFTKAENNLLFSTGIGYLPVQKETLTKETLLEVRKQSSQVFPGEVITNSLLTANTMLEEYTLSSLTPFLGSYDIKSFLNNSLPVYLKEFQEELIQQQENGTTKKSAVAKMTSDQAFERWYQQFLMDGAAIIEEGRENSWKLK